MSSTNARLLRVALFGFGDANKSFAKLLLEKQEELLAGGLRVAVVALFTGSRGCAMLQEGSDCEASIPLETLAAVPKAEGLRSTLEACGGLVTREGSLALEEVVAELSLLRRRGLLDAVVEAVPAAYENGHPALGLARAMLPLGVHYISANKAPVALALDELEALAAAEPACRFLFESSCMDGVPIFNMVRRCLPAVRVVGFEGILNSTTNVILSALEDSPDMSFEEALARAQAAGITETDPSGDIDGFDAAIKCVCLCRALLKAPMSIADVEPLQGIRGIGQAEVAAARADGGSRLMLVCEGQLVDGRATSSVRLRRIMPSSPLFCIRGASACVTLHTDMLGPVTIVSTDPTIRDTGYGLLADLLEASRWQAPT